MNFKNMPELDWDYGYVMFWCIAGMQIICAVCFLIYSRRTAESGPVIVLDEQRQTGDEERRHARMKEHEGGETPFIRMKLEPLVRMLSGKSAMFRTGKVDSST